MQKQRYQWFIYVYFTPYHVPSRIENQLFNQFDNRVFTQLFIQFDNRLFVKFRSIAFKKYLK